MTHADLAAELDTARLGLHVADARVALAKRGAALANLRAWPAIGAATIERCGRTFQFFPGGEMAYIVAEPILMNSDLAEPDWQLIDFAAVPVADPSVILTRCDQAWALGAYNARMSIASHKPLVVHETFFDWLASRRTGLLIIDHERAGEMLSFVPQIVGQSPRHAQRLRDLVRPLPVPAPEVLLSSSHLKQVRHG